jgi:hypothetical protein
LQANIARWNNRYSTVNTGLQAEDRIVTIKRPAAESPVGSSIQFRVPVFGADQCRALLVAAAARGVELKWFGAVDPVGFTSSHHSWRYVAAQALPRTDDTLASLFDMRLPLTFSIEDCTLIATLICDAVTEVAA